MAKARTKNEIAVADDRAPKAPGQPLSVAGSDIASRAYALYLERGCQHGHDLDDWLQAERELKRTVTSSAA